MPSLLILNKKNPIVPQVRIFAFVAVAFALLGFVGCSRNDTAQPTSKPGKEIQVVDADTIDCTIDHAQDSIAISYNDEKYEPVKIDGELEIHFIDVGQADATLVKIGSHAMLVDCGTDDVGTKIQYYLKNHGVEKLDYLVLTHPDSDHIGGADVIITKFDIDKVFMSPFTKDNNWYADLLNALKYKGYSWSTPEVGSNYELGKADFTIVAPNRLYEDPNNSSIAFVLKYGDTRFLFTGDASEEAEADIVSNGLDISADVYKMGHHGSRTASTEGFIERVNPKYVVISCSTGNEYGHPHEEALQRIRRYSPEIYRTDEQGTIIAYSDGKKITWNHSPSTTWACGIQVQEEIPQIYNDIMKIEPSEDIDNSPGDRSKISGTTYVLNINTKKFHNPDCDSVMEMKPKNRKDVDWTREECIENGYKPCGSCKP